MLVKNYCWTMTSPDNNLFSMPGVILLPSLWTNCQLILFALSVTTCSLLILVTRSPFFMSMNIVLFSLAWATDIYNSSTDWFMYTLVIMFLGGMMVMFTYAASLSSLFKLSFGKIPHAMGALLVVALIASLFDKSYTVSLFGNTTPWMGYSWLSFYFMVMMVLMIVTVLFIVVKLVQVNEGPIKMN